MKKQWIVGILVLVVGAFLVIKFAGQEKKEEENVIKIGAILPLTGAGSEFAQYIKEGIDLAIVEVNNSSKTKFFVKYEDSKTQPKEGVASYQKIIATDDPLFTIVALSSVAKAIAPIAIENKKQLVLTAVAIPNVTNGKNIIRIYPEANGMAGVMAKYNAENLKAKTSAVIYLNDDFGRASLEVYKNEFSKYGGTLLMNEPYEMQQTDFKTLLLKLRSLPSTPDVIYLSGYGPAYASIVKQLREANVKSTITADMTMGLPNTLRVCGSASEGVVFVDGKMNSGFIEKFNNKYSKEPTSYSGYSYDIIKMAVAAIGIEPPLQKVFSESLIDLGDYNGAMGKIKIEANGESNLEFAVKKITNGKIIFITQ